MGLNCLTEVHNQFLIFLYSTPLRDHCVVVIVMRIRGDFKYYFAVPPLPFTDFFFGSEEVTDLGVPPPFTDFSPKFFLQKGLKIVIKAELPRGELLLPHSLLL